MPYANKEEALAYARKYYREHRGAALGRRYGLTAEEYEAVVADNRCAVCGSSERRKGHETLYVDHDHATGVVRGLLCHACNLTLGNAKDDPARLRALADYLERSTT